MQRRIYFFGGGEAEGDGSQRALLGGKGAGLAEMTRLGIPVPPGFTITTDECLAYFAHERRLSPELDGALDEALARVSAIVGARFGDPESPLLVSVRSGARASMPGMMDTILNLGMNDAVAAGLARRTGDARFALDTQRRFLTMFADVVLGVPRERFAAPLEEARLATAAERGVEVRHLNAEELRRRIPDAELSEASLRAVIARSRAVVEEVTGAPFPDDPREQLRRAIAAVFDSWFNERAKVYRKMYGIPESWGTACTVQAMVFGNLGERSGTGVAFTRDPSTGERRFFGEWLPRAQGEDVVAGLRTPHPVAAGSGGDDSLERRMPEAYGELLATQERLEAHLRDMLDLEFTVQEGRLYLLQVRAGKRTARAAVRIAVDMVREGLIREEEALARVEAASLDQILHPMIDPAADKTLLARGLPASPGAVSGQVVFHADEAERRAGQGKAVILVRVETSPEDIHGMKAARGILTARGGMTSHAALVARGMGKCCVAGCSAVSISYEHQVMTVTQYDESGRVAGTLSVRAGETITLDGSNGAVYLGDVPTLYPRNLVPELDDLLRWADRHRRLRVRANADTPRDAHVARDNGAEGIGLCRTEHMFFDEERILHVREMILAPDETARRRALDKLFPFQRRDFFEIFREMAGLPVTIRLLDPPLHEFLPTEPAQLEALSREMGISIQELSRKRSELFEANPMLGHRGCRLAVTYPEIYEMQVRAILEAACDATEQGQKVLPEIMIPLAITRRELEITRAQVDKVAGEVARRRGLAVPFAFGTMIELPRAALAAAELGGVAEFFSFGTNDLTQTTLGLSRDDAGKFLGAYVETGIFPADPFLTLDRDGVGELMAIARDRGRGARPGLKLGICGEHGGDPASIRLCAELGLDYVSCSPKRLPIARLAAAQAALAAAQETASTA